MRERASGLLLANPRSRSLSPSPSAIALFDHEPSGYKASPPLRDAPFAAPSNQARESRMRFTIVTVCFKSAGTIAQTLASVAAQDFHDYEHLVVDGASPDRTMEIVRQHAHGRLRWVSEPDNGIYDAMNKGLRMAQGDYVLFLNSDDLLARTDALSAASQLIDESGADCIFADTQFVQSDGVTPGRRVYSARRFRRWWMRLGVMPPHPSAFIRRELLNQVGGFDTSYRISADFDLLAKVLLKAGASWRSLPAVTTNFRMGGLSTSGLATNLRLGRELARSLRSLGQPLPELAVQLRFLLKAAQFRPFRWRRRTSATAAGSSR
jgi:cellulose synthase/poly-beta-1,6-N-acetylglucosamine synthase-like glycosyltransferase